MTPEDHFIKITKTWIARFIIGLDICPFASGVEDLISYDVHHETEEVTIINQALEMTHRISQGDKVKTGFLILPSFKGSFEEFYALSQMLQAEIDHHFPDQFVLVAFHPRFRYADVDEQDIGNAVNRSPFPMIHALSSRSLDEVSDSQLASEQITSINQSKLNELTWQKLHDIYSVPMHKKEDL